MSDSGAPARPEYSPKSTMNFWALGLLWFAGINLRVTLLAVPPLIPLIHQDLSLSEKAVGALGGLPVLIFGKKMTVLLRPFADAYRVKWPLAMLTIGLGVMIVSAIVGLVYYTYFT